MKILIVDDSRLDRIILSERLKDQGHAVIEACNGEEALEKFKIECPDLILMDVVMPKMDGLQATARIRFLDPHQWTPIIILTASNSSEDIVKGVEAGADEYIGKPINWMVLTEKLKIFNRIQSIQKKISHTVNELEKYKNEKERENRFAEKILENHLQGIDLSHRNIRHCNVPAGSLSGDVMSVVNSPTGETYLLLADGMGHGLPAAICVSPIIDIFHAMGKKGFALNRIVEEMNNKLLQSVPSGFFVAAAVLCVDGRSQTVEAWNGGMPAPFFMNFRGEVSHSFISQNPSLGVLKAGAFCSDTEKYKLPGPGTLFLYSDGLLSIQLNDEMRLDETSLTQVLRGIDYEKRFDFIASTAVELRSQNRTEDGISIMAVNLEVDQSVPEGPQIRTKGHEVKEIGNFQFNLNLNAILIKKVALLPILYQMFCETDLEKETIERFMVILTELFINAVDHGLLKLDSSLKNSSDGLFRYQKLRQERLKNLKEGFLNLSITCSQTGGMGHLKIFLKDSGSGFPFDAILNRGESNPEMKTGRGLKLVKGLGAELKFSEQGSAVEATVRI